MQVLPIDLPAVIATTLGLLCLLLPMAGLTLRFALKPLVEAWGLRNHSRDEVALLEKRVALLERELELRRLPAVTEVGQTAHSARNSSVTVGA
ncbi:MAG TPA: hypothetical protein VFA20_24490 [Myxococcaceae bacterium]|nr:hypothetical protein [Myxococcaceae bacterium]